MLCLIALLVFIVSYAAGADRPLALPHREPYQPPLGVQRAPVLVASCQRHNGLPPASRQCSHFHSACKPPRPRSTVLPACACNLVCHRDGSFTYELVVSTISERVGKAHPRLGTSLSIQWHRFGTMAAAVFKAVISLCSYMSCLCRGGLMYLHAVGWQIGKKDKIDLEGPKLKEKEGLYTCPPVSLGQKPFHCCLKVREEFIKVSATNC